MRGLSCVASIAAACCTAALLAPNAALAIPGTCQSGEHRFTYVGAEQCYTVPAGVRSLSVLAVGAPGGNGASSTGSGGVGGKGADGAQVEATIAVTPGQTLYVEVGGRGEDGSITPVTNGGFNGGGSTSVAGPIAEPTGGGGGGASDVRTLSCGGSCPGSSESLDSRLLVAGGGGGGGSAAGAGSGGAGGGAEGASGADGAEAAPIANGDPGHGGGGAVGATGGAGGAKGSGCGSGNAKEGTLGSGGEGGTLSEGSGGGGGGGLAGGGGGGGGCGASAAGSGGGGGGSSYGPQGAIVKQASTAEPSVSITPGTAAAQAGPSKLSFSQQPQATLSLPQTVTIDSTGGADLTVTGMKIAGMDPGDFFVGTSTCGAAIEPGKSCEVTVWFAPHAEGAREAILEVLSNDPSGPASVALYGTGGALPQGPAGATGTTGAQGPRGPRGRPGKVEVLTCRTVSKRGKGHRRPKRALRCAGRLLSGALKLTSTSAGRHARLSRHGRLYAIGLELDRRRARTLLLSPVRKLRHGRYTLTLGGRHRRRVRVFIR